VILVPARAAVGTLLLRTVRFEFYKYPAACPAVDLTHKTDKTQSRGHALLARFLPIRFSLLLQHMIPLRTCFQ
jgi:hypothetical protein